MIDLNHSRHLLRQRNPPIRTRIINLFRLLGEASRGHRACLGEASTKVRVRPCLAVALLLPAFGAQAGVVFTNLHSFQVSPIGAYPFAGVVQGSDGDFYGTTANGGGNGDGTVFKISTNGALTSLYSFTGGNDGANPDAGLVQGSDGYFYGTTFGGGTNGNGTVFKITANGALTHLYSFTGGIDGPWQCCQDPSVPQKRGICVPQS